MTTIHFANVLGQPRGEPISLDRRRRRLSTVAKQYGSARQPFLVSVHRGVEPGGKVVPSDDTVRSRASWKDTLVGADDVVLITYLPLGGAAGGQKAGKQIGMAIGVIALAVAMPFAVAALPGMTTVAGALTLTGKMIAAGLTGGIPVGPSQTFYRSAK